MWEVRGQSNKPNPEVQKDVLEWSSVLVETREEAERWWNCRTSFRQTGKVSTMYDPNGSVVKVKFD